MSVSMHSEGGEMKYAKLCEGLVEEKLQGGQSTGIMSYVLYVSIVCGCLGPG
jgi:hypothetical protein